jgi:hypothetical protein
VHRTEEERRSDGLHRQHAGLEHGLQRSGCEARVLAMQAVAAALLLGPMHWLGLRSWRRVAHRLENEPNTSR